MIGLHIGNMFPPEQIAHWKRAIAELRRMERSDRSDPFVFHGTTSISAAHIMRDGFNPSFIRAQPIEGKRTGATPYPMSCDGVHWGSVNIAAWAAEKNFSADDRPVILYARASDVIGHGVAVPDWMALEHSMGRPYQRVDWPHHQGPIPDDANWHISLDRAGAFGVIDGRHVANLMVFDPFADMPVHPGWKEARDDRTASYAGSSLLPRKMPPPGHVEPTPETHPPVWTRREASIAVWGEELILQGEALRRSEAEALEAEAEGAPSPGM